MISLLSLTRWGGRPAAIGAAIAAVAYSLTSAPAVAATAANPTGGIYTTAHNLSATQPEAGANHSTAGEICVFCHTPHGANTSVQAPLWNRNNSTATYTTYADTGSGTLDGTVLAVGSVSLACLSCHDGTQALDAVINGAGAGANLDANGRMLNYAGTANLTWSGDEVDPTTGKLKATAISNLGTDLSNDHPIGIAYGGTINADLSTKDPDFVTPTKSATTSRYWIDTTLTAGTGTDGVRDKTDLPLYNRTDGVAGQAYVECATCHDPHGTTDLFLRVANNTENGAAFASGLCLSCHVK